MSTDDIQLTLAFIHINIVLFSHAVLSTVGAVCKKRLVIFKETAPFA
ncbi:MAG: hypothetical protein QXS79_04070 [Candidatus Bathyarchaeia archaeon]